MYRERAPLNSNEAEDLVKTQDVKSHLYLEEPWLLPTTHTRPQKARVHKSQHLPLCYQVTTALRTLIRYNVGHVDQLRPVAEASSSLSDST